MLTRKYSKVRVDNKLTLGKGASLVSTSDAGVETSISAAELVALNDLSATDLAKIDGITNGTVAASKAVVVDTNKDVGDFRNLDVVNLDAGASGTAGSVDVFPATASKGKLALTCTDQTGDTTVSVVAGAMAAARTITLRDPGAAASILTTTDATAAATAATAVEITRACDVSARLVAAGGTLAVTVDAHDGKTILLDTAGGSVCTLPAAAATGARIRFVVSVRPSGGSHIIKVANASGGFAGQINILDLDAAAQAAYLGDATTGDDTITINNTTTGGAIGDYIEVEDTLANFWTVRGALSVPAGSNPADPFSATVN